MKSDSARSPWARLWQSWRARHDIRVRSDAMQMAPEGVMVLDADGVCVISNGHADRLAAGSAVGMRVMDLLDARCHDQAREALSSREVVRFMARAGGDTTPWLLVSSSPRLDDDQRRIGTVMFFSDATSLREADDGARRSGTLRDELLSIAAHELRSRIGTVRFDAAALSDHLLETISTGDVSPAVQAVRSIGKHMESLGRLVSDMLDSSQIHAGRVELRREHFDLVALVRDVVREFAEEAAHTGSSVAVHAPSVVDGSWDRVRVTQIITNLLTNALKYGEARPVEVVVMGHDEWATIVVRDQGIGIASEHHTRIFGQFERLTVPGRSYRGIGLGLWIVQRMAELHGGSVSVRSELGAGAELTVRLPR